MQLGERLSIVAYNGTYIALQCPRGYIRFFQPFNGELDHIPGQPMQRREAMDWLKRQACKVEDFWIALT